ncbi:hypothetical protein HPB50_010513 [Hyalomma asiaticum]|uniref:Uncharacterized protein n=1 Tax=Hyalomma asiaticum TaxID=266040 RepID=A0ACB7RWP4_HYAAI|nr:hypothetical protein HPB50_010513 [Hyalomma asiaticum]
MLSPITSCLLRLALTFHWNLRAEHKQENIIFSPFGIGTALSMTALASSGNTERQLYAALNLTNCVGRMAEHVSTLLDVRSTPDAFLIMANRMYADRRLTIRTQYRLLLDRFYQAIVAQADFEKNPEALRADINAWVSYQTGYKVKQLLPVGSVNNRTQFVLVSALSFQALWEQPFEKSYSKVGSFSVSVQRDVEVVMMYREGKFKIAYADDLMSVAVELPYKGGRFSMVIFLPYELEGLQTVEKRLTERRLRSVFQHLSVDDVGITLPKFKLDFRSDIKRILQSLGVKDLFQPGAADLSGMVESGKPWLSDIHHEVFLQVDEGGTEAAAPAAAVGVNSPPPDPSAMTYIDVDHPFLFLIKDNAYNIILFMGSFVEPNGKY